MTPKTTPPSAGLFGSACAPKILGDIACLTGAFWAAHGLRVGLDASAPDVHWAATQAAYVVSLQLGMLFAFSTFRSVWRFVGLVEALALLRAVCAAAVPLFALQLALPERLYDLRVPLAVLCVDTILAFGFLLGVRVIVRLAHDRREQGAKIAAPPVAAKRILIVGTGSCGAGLARFLRERAPDDLDVVGFVVDDANAQGSLIRGVPVVGAVAELPQLIASLRIDEVVIGLVETTRAEVRAITEASAPAPVRIMPGPREIASGADATQIRPLRVEDLLGRAPWGLDEVGLRRLLTGKRVMVTGAGGSIGSELARQVASLAPSELSLVERAEFALFDVDREIAARHPRLRLDALVADISDEERMRNVFSTSRPQVVFHAAAHKHVPLMEANPCEAIKNNLLASKLLAALSIELGVETFVLISTDKAVRPTSVMGASKRLAEIVLRDMSRGSATRFVAVRFGNVLGSHGSVLPIFADQIRRGGPVTVTHPEMVRYFMTIPEAAHLVLEAGAVGKGGEVFMLNMGEPIRIVDLAKDLIRLSGRDPAEIEITFSGMRPGEKLTEELAGPAETLEPTTHPKVLVVRGSASPPPALAGALLRLERLAREGRAEAIRALLSELLPEARLGGGGAASVGLVAAAR